jgi:phosphocarrier protein HPr
MKRALPNEHRTRASCEITIRNQLGLHARPAAEFVRQANSFRCDSWLVTKQGRFSALSLIEVMHANLDCGAKATLEAEGTDAAQAVEHLSRVVREMRDYDN